MKGHRIIFVLVGVLITPIVWVAIQAVGNQATGQPPPVTYSSPPPTLQPIATTAPAPKKASEPEAPPVRGEAGPGYGQFEKELAAKDVPLDSTATQTNDNPTGRQEPAISLEWIGPPVAKVGQAVTCQIIVKNISGAPVQDVLVRNRIPTGVTVLSTQPKALNEGNSYIWDLGTLESRQEKRLDLQLQPFTKGDLACQASVTFTGSSTSHLMVREPKLAIKATGPDKVLLGDLANFTFIVENPGDGMAEQVKVKATLPEGLENTRGGIVEFDVGNLRPQESRSVQLVCTTKAGGEQKCEVVAVAEGNLRAETSAMVDVIVPRIDIAGTGPKLRYLGRPAVYVFKVTNSGSAPTTNVTVSDQIPEGFKFQNASAGGRHDFATRTVSWYIGELSPGQSQEVSLEVLAINPGEHKHRAFVEAARGLRNDTEVVTQVEGLSALLMELVDLDDPVEIGVDTAYEIRVTNTGSKTETNLQLICTIPEKMEFRGAKGVGDCKSHLQGKELIFDPLPKLAPRADAIYRVNVRGVAAGDLRFRARIMADGLSDPVLKEESTKVYGDTVPVPSSPNPNP